MRLVAGERLTELEERFADLAGRLDDLAGRFAALAGRFAVVVRFAFVFLAGDRFAPDDLPADLRPPVLRVDPRLADLVADFFAGRFAPADLPRELFFFAAMTNHS